MDYQTSLLGPTGKPLTEYTVAELDKETLQKAVVQTAFAYWHHNPEIQYDISNTCVCFSSRAGGRRLNCREAPEQAGYDTEIYTSCTKYIFAVYHDTFDYEMPGYDTWWEQEYDTSPNGEIVVVKYGDIYGSCGETDKAKATAMVDERIEPGDIVFASPYNDAHGGHTMLYVGNYKGDGKRYVLHSWPVDGGRLNKETGADKREPHGAITLQRFEDLILTDHGKPNYCINGEKIGFFFLFRLFNSSKLKDYRLTPSAVSRLEYPFLSIHKWADRLIYDDVLPGEEITIFQKLRNNSKQAYRELAVQECVPEGAELVRAKGAVRDGRNLLWKVHLGPSEEIVLTYTVRNNKKRGELLVFDGGHAAMIPTRKMIFKVGGERLTDAQNAALAAISPENLPALCRKDMDAVNEFYKTVLGVRLELPKTLTEYLDRRFTVREEHHIYGDTVVPMLHAEGCTDRYLLELEINHGMTGFYLYTGNDSSGRIFDILPQYFTAGDIFVTYKTRSAEKKELAESGIYYIMLDDHRVLRLDKDGAAVLPFAETVQNSLLDSIFVALRPTLGYDRLENA